MSKWRTMTTISLARYLRKIWRQSKRSQRRREKTICSLIDSGMTLGLSDIRRVCTQVSMSTVKLMKCSCLCHKWILSWLFTKTSTPSGIVRSIPALSTPKKLVSYSRKMPISQWKGHLHKWQIGIIVRIGLSSPTLILSTTRSPIMKIQISLGCQSAQVILMFQWGLKTI